MKKKTIYIFTTLLLISILVVFTYYQKIFGTAIAEEHVLFVTTKSSLSDVSDGIEKLTQRPETFLWVAAKKNFSNPKAGRYILKPGMSNNDLVNMLRSGRQTPLKLSFNNQDTLEKLAGRIASQIAADSISLLQSFKEDTFLNAHNFTSKSILQIIMLVFT